MGATAAAEAGIEGGVEGDAAEKAQQRLCKSSSQPAFGRRCKPAAAHLSAVSAPTQQLYKKQPLLSPSPPTRPALPGSAYCCCCCCRAPGAPAPGPLLVRSPAGCRLAVWPWLPSTTSSSNTWLMSCRVSGNSSSSSRNLWG